MDDDFLRQFKDRLTQKRPVNRIRHASNKNIGRRTGKEITNVKGVADVSHLFKSFASDTSDSLSDIVPSDFIANDFISSQPVDSPKSATKRARPPTPPDFLVESSSEDETLNYGNKTDSDYVSNANKQTSEESMQQVVQPSSIQDKSSINESKLHSIPANNSQKISRPTLDNGNSRLLTVQVKSVSKSQKKDGHRHGDKRGGGDTSTHKSLHVVSEPSLEPQSKSPRMEEKSPPRRIKHTLPLSASQQDAKQLIDTIISSRKFAKSSEESDQGVKVADSRPIATPKSDQQVEKLTNGSRVRTPDVINDYVQMIGSHKFSDINVGGTKTGSITKKLTAPSHAPTPTQSQVVLRRRLDFSDANKTPSTSPKPKMKVPEPEEVSAVHPMFELDAYSVNGFHDDELIFETAEDYKIRNKFKALTPILKPSPNLLRRRSRSLTKQDKSKTARTTSNDKAAKENVNASKVNKKKKKKYQSKKKEPTQPGSLVNQEAMEDSASSVAKSKRKSRKGLDFSNHRSPSTSQDRSKSRSKPTWANMDISVSAKRSNNKRKPNFIKSIVDYSSSSEEYSPEKSTSKKNRSSSSKAKSPRKLSTNRNLSFHNSNDDRDNIIDDVTVPEVKLLGSTSKQSHTKSRIIESSQDSESDGETTMRYKETSRESLAKHNKKKGASRWDTSQESLHDSQPPGLREGGEAKKRARGQLKKKDEGIQDISTQVSKKGANASRLKKKEKIKLDPKESIVSRTRMKTANIRIIESSEDSESDGETTMIYKETSRESRRDRSQESLHDSQPPVLRDGSETKKRGRGRPKKNIIISEDYRESSNVNGIQDVSNKEVEKEANASRLKKKEKIKLDPKESIEYRTKMKKANGRIIESSEDSESEGETKMIYKETSRESSKHNKGKGESRRNRTQESLHDSQPPRLKEVGEEKKRGRGQIKENIRSKKSLRASNDKGMQDVSNKEVEKAANASRLKKKEKIKLDPKESIVSRTRFKTATIIESSEDSGSDGEATMIYKETPRESLLKHNKGKGESRRETSQECLRDSQHPVLKEVGKEKKRARGQPKENIISKKSLRSSNDKGMQDVSTQESKGVKIASRLKKKETANLETKELMMDLNRRKQGSRIIKSSNDTEEDENASRFKKKEKVKRDPGESTLYPSRLKKAQSRILKSSEDSESDGETTIRHMDTSRESLAKQNKRKEASRWDTSQESLQDSQPPVLREGSETKKRGRPKKIITNEKSLKSSNDVFIQESEKEANSSGLRNKKKFKPVPRESTVHPSRLKKNRNRILNSLEDSESDGETTMRNKEESQESLSTSNITSHSQLKNSKQGHPDKSDKSKEIDRNSNMKQKSKENLHQTSKFEMEPDQTSSNMFPDLEKQTSQESLPDPQASTSRGESSEKKQRYNVTNSKRMKKSQQKFPDESSESEMEQDQTGLISHHDLEKETQKLRNQALTKKTKSPLGLASSGVSKKKKKDEMISKRLKMSGLDLWLKSGQKSEITEQLETPAKAQRIPQLHIMHSTAIHKRSHFPVPRQEEGPLQGGDQTMFVEPAAQDEESPPPLPTVNQSSINYLNDQNRVKSRISNAFGPPASTPRPVVQRTKKRIESSPEATASEKILSASESEASRISHNSHSVQNDKKMAKTKKGKQTKIKSTQKSNLKTKKTKKSKENSEIRNERTSRSKKGKNVIAQNVETTTDKDSEVSTHEEKSKKSKKSSSRAAKATPEHQEDSSDDTLVASPKKMKGKPEKPVEKKAKKTAAAKKSKKKELLPPKPTPSDLDSNVPAAGSYRNESAEEEGEGMQWYDSVCSPNKDHPQHGSNVPHLKSNIPEKYYRQTSQHSDSNISGISAVSGNTTLRMVNKDKTLSVVDVSHLICDPESQTFVGPELNIRGHKGIKLSKGLSSEDSTQGMLIVNPLTTKEERTVKQTMMCFFVHSGTIRVRIQGVTQTVGRNYYFRVPYLNSYTMYNPDEKIPAVLHYTLIQDRDRNK